MVASGENIYTIANRYGVTPKDIRKWTDSVPTVLPKVAVCVCTSITEVSHLLPPRQRKTEKDGAVKAGQKATPVVTKSNQTARVSGKSLTYKVQSGDSLYSIAKKYPGVSTDDLQRANGLTSADIRPGQVLKNPGRLTFSVAFGDI